LHLCTIVPIRRLAQGRVLVNSLRAHHPGTDVHVLILDDRTGEITESSQPFRLLRPGDLAFSEGEFENLAMLCEEEQLVEALIPRLLLHLVEAGLAPATYIGHSQLVLGSLTTMDDAVRATGAVVAPRVRWPLPADGRTPSDADALERGLISSSLVGATIEAKEFLSWWADGMVDEARGEAHPDRRLAPMHARALRQALHGTPRIRWLDLAGAYFGTAVDSDPGTSVSFWNLNGRRIARSEDGWAIDGHPLRTFDFEGFSVEKPFLLSLDQGTKPRVLLSEHPGLRDLCADYAARLDAQDVRTWSNRPYGFGVLSDGVPIDHRMRGLYREGLRFDVLNRGLPPNPFVSGDEEDFLAWLNEPVFGGLSRYLSTVYAERTDLQAVFRDPSEPLLLKWAHESGPREERIHPKLLPALDKRDAEQRGQVADRPPDLVSGANVIGFLSAQAGLGVSGRALQQALDRASIPHSLVPLAHPFADERGSRQIRDAPYDVNIVCGTPDLIIAVGRDLGGEILRNRYNVGLFFWEAEQFLPHVAQAFDLTDEVWASSRFIADAVSPIFDGPVQIYPHPFIPPPTPPSLNRAELGLPEGFLFLFVFDYSSSFKRKNPLGAVKAFKTAFEPGEGPILAIKSIVGEHRLVEREQLWFETINRPDIFLLEGTWPEAKKDALMAMAGCYVSLHRSEGLGMTMAESMILGKPVIATGYSGNMEFMSSENSYLVRYGMTKVGPDADPYHPDWEWAEPDIGHAAELMRQVYEDQHESQRRGALGREHLLRRHSVDRAAAFIRQRLDDVRRDRPRSSASRDEPAAEAQHPAIVNQAEQRARELVERGADLSLPSRFGSFGRFIRRIVMLLLRPYDRHQREVQRAILEAAREGAEPRSDTRD
jgi:glycosyltransferase involved in cell wall biosynthesis